MITVFVHRNGTTRISCRSSTRRCCGPAAEPSVGGPGRGDQSESCGSCPTSSIPCSGGGRRRRGAPSSENRSLQRLSLPDSARHRLPEVARPGIASSRTTPTSSSGPTTWSRSTTARRAASRHPGRLRTQRPRARRRARRADAPDHRSDGRQLPAGDRAAGKVAGRAGTRASSTCRRKETVREILSVKQDVTALRRISTPQRDAIGRLARREFPLIPEELTSDSATCTTTWSGLPTRG